VEYEPEFEQQAEIEVEYEVEGQLQYEEEQFEAAPEQVYGGEQVYTAQAYAGYEGQQ